LFVGCGAAALFGCSLSVDAEQARVCRTALPALNASSTRIVVERAQPGPGEHSVRVDYAVDAEGGPAVRRWALCRFAAEGLSLRKAELVGITTERGPLSGSSVYLLRRFYIDTPEGIVGDPGPGDQAAGLAEAPPALAYLLQQMLVGLPRTAIYGLLAAAYALVFGLVGRINLAFGELAAVGAAAAVSGVALASGLNLHTPVAGLGIGLACALFAGAMHSAVGGHFTIARIDSRSAQPSLIATVGLSLFLMEYLRLAQSPVTVWIPPLWSDAVPLVRAGSFVVGVTPVSLLTTALGALAAAAVLLLLHRSGFGLNWRAYADDPKAARLCGVDGPRLLTRTLAISGALAALAGTLVVVQYGGLGFAGGFGLGLKALIAAVLGGIGSVAGALLGGLAIGTFETLWSAYFPIEMRDVALYASLIAVLVFRPGGLVGTRDARPREV
jgi:branched-chain amino acid transport system permease protein